jgi:hypothetical protein
VVKREVIHAADNLSLVVHPQQYAGLASSLGQRRQQNTHQDGHDEDGDEKLNESESYLASKPCAKYVTFGTDSSPPIRTLSQILNHDTTDHYMLQPDTPVDSTSRQTHGRWRLFGLDRVS